MAIDWILAEALEHLSIEDLEIADAMTGYLKDATIRDFLKLSLLATGWAQVDEMDDHPLFVPLRGD